MYFVPILSNPILSSLEMDSLPGSKTDLYCGLFFTSLMSSLLLAFVCTLIVTSSALALSCFTSFTTSAFITFATTVPS